EGITLRPLSFDTRVASRLHLHCGARLSRHDGAVDRHLFARHERAAGGKTCGTVGIELIVPLGDRTIHAAHLVEESKLASGWQDVASYAALKLHIEEIDLSACGVAAFRPRPGDGAR